MLEVFLIGTLLMVFVFFATWLLCLRLKNYGFVDVAFSYGMTLLAPLYAWSGTGTLERKLVFTGVGLAWSLRLGTYLLVRVAGHHPKEDSRYEALRERWSGPWMFLLFFEMQAVLVVIFSLPFLFSAFNPAPELRVSEMVGLAVAGLALLGESLADIQMQRFKRNPANSGEVCQVGLWNYSRHPNYFFESMIWWGLALAALSSPSGWICVICPLMMLYFLLRVTGIPLTEEYAIKRRGERYREYQRTTSAFVPWFKKTGADSQTKVAKS
jgi:steroid 5-alpha reductase family enzyme